MRRLGRSTATTLLCLGFLAACGPPPDAQQPITGPGASPRDNVVAGGATTAAYPPAAEPSGVVATARWKNPAATLATSSTCAGVPPAVLDAILKVGVDELFNEVLRGGADTKALAGLVAQDAPVDAVVAIDPASKRPNAFAAVAVGLTSLEAARKAIETGGPATELAPGVWKVGGKERRSARCAVAAGGGGAPARLVCGDSDKDLVALAAWMARTLPGQPSVAADLHGEARFAPVEQRWGADLKQILRQLPLLAKGEVGIGEPKFDDAVVEAATAAQEDLVALMADLDRVTLDVSLASGSCQLVGTGALQMRNKTSWFTQTMVDRPERQGPPPALFWRLPKDSTSASFGRGSDPARYTRVLKIIRNLVDGGLTKAKVGSPADRKALTDIIVMPLGKDTNIVQGTGRFAPVAPAKPGATLTSQQKMEGLMGSTVGWTVVGLDEGPDNLTKWLKELVAVWNRAGLQGPLKKELGADTAKSLPVVKTVPAPRELGAGAMAIEIKVPNIDDPDDPPFDAKTGKMKANRKKITLTFHIVVMGEDKTTWLAVGSKKDELLKRLVSVKAGAPDANTLATRPGLEPLKQGKNLGGGFFTLAPIVDAAKSAAEVAMPSGPPPPEVAELLSALNNLPNKGETPMLLTFQVAAGNAPRIAGSLQVSKGTMEDVAKLASAAASAANSAKRGATMSPAPVAVPPPPTTATPVKPVAPPQAPPPKTTPKK